MKESLYFQHFPNFTSDSSKTNDKGRERTDMPSMEIYMLGIRMARRQQMLSICWAHAQPELGDNL
jgi:hypothetical protein